MKGEGGEYRGGAPARSLLVKGIPLENLGLTLKLLLGKGEGEEYLGVEPARSRLVKGIPIENLGAVLAKSRLVKGLLGENLGVILYDLLGNGEAGEYRGAILKDCRGKGDPREYLGLATTDFFPKGEPADSLGLMGAPVEVLPKESDKGAEVLFFFRNSRKPRGSFLTVFNRFSVSSSNCASATSDKENRRHPKTDMVKNRRKDQRLPISGTNSTISNSEVPPLSSITVLWVKNCFQGWQRMEQVCQVKPHEK